ncbi:MAG: iron-containing alcohol dehydrogenase [Clostridia bacterium]|nr:iron-containing alcohol dehydrogenase [Clostridia bacterium]
MALNTDIAYKFGCGRYIQEKNAIEDNLAVELARFGKKALFICGENGYKAAHTRIENALKNTKLAYEFTIFTSTPCFETADELAAYANDNGFDIICGVGGGVVMDTVKFAAERADLTLVQIPTISATCAAATPLSVLYDRNTHAHIGSIKLMKEADAVIVDLGIMIDQPPRLFWAGIMDSMAKLI